MAEQASNPTIPLLIRPWAQTPSLRSRVAGMALLWTLLGAGVGAGMKPGSGVIGLVSGVLAGLIVLVPLGVLLGLIGGRVKPVMGGALCGAAVGALTGMLAGMSNPFILVNVGLIGGGMVGATSSAMFWWVHLVARNVALPGRSQG